MPNLNKTLIGENIVVKSQLKKEKKDKIRCTNKMFCFVLGKY